MAKATNKTQPTTVAPEDFLATVVPERRRQEGLELLALFDRVTGLQAKMWGPSIIGYGRYHYKYESGREGEMILTGSALLTIAHLKGRLMTDEVWQATHIDEDWQIENWGEDEEAQARRAKRREELQSAAGFLAMLSA